jgi:C-terminal processing protease CtpA/Prc
VKRNLISFGFGVLGFFAGALGLVFLRPEIPQKLEANKETLASQQLELKPISAPSSVSTPTAQAVKASDKEKIEPSSTPKTASVKPNLENIYQILSENYADLDLLKRRDIRQAAVKGILNTLEGSVSLVDSSKDASNPKQEHGDALKTISVIDPSIGYVRLNQIDSEVTTQFKSSVLKLIHDSNISDLILDLRFASSSNFSAVSGLASLFLSKPESIFSIQKNGKTQEFESQPVSDSLSLPLIILVNHETSGAFEVFAAVMQEKGRAVIIGNSSTANQIYETSDITLENGQVLRVASSKIVLASGRDLFLKPVQPDVKTELDAKIEKEIFKKPFQKPEPQVNVRFFSEAILTGKETAPPLPKTKKKDVQSEPASNRDLSLLTAVDILKSVKALGVSPNHDSAQAASKS